MVDKTLKTADKTLKGAAKKLGRDYAKI